MLDFLFNANSLVGIGAVIFALSYTYSNIRSGSQKSNIEVIAIYKDQIEAQKAVIADLQNQVNKMQQDIGKLQGLHEANEKKIKEYMDLLGPSGELKATLKELRTSSEIIPQVKEFMNQQSDFIKSFQKGEIGLTAEVKAKQ